MTWRFGSQGTKGVRALGKEGGAECPVAEAGEGAGLGLRWGRGYRCPGRCAVGKARTEHEPCLRHMPGFCLQMSQAVGTAGRWDLSSLHRPFLSRRAWTQHSQGNTGFCFGPGPNMGCGCIFWGLVSAPARGEAAPRTGSSRETPGRPTKRLVPGRLTCRWVMFLSMFMGDVTQLCETYL